MSLVNVSIYCDTYELDLLLLKLILENSAVSEWVIAENCYNYHSKFKSFSLAKSIKNDSRFNIFRDKITVVELDKQFGGDSNTTDPKEFSDAEATLREAPWNYINRKYNDDVKVIVSDIDEVFDFTDISRKTRIKELLGRNVPLQFDRLRYWWDINNRSWREPGDMITPVYSMKNLRDGTAKLSNKKWIGEIVHLNNFPLVFEYCFCFNYDAVLSKYNSSLHTKQSKELINDSINMNFWTRTTYQNLDFNNRFLWFERVNLTEKNSPKYVRDNFNALKTNLVPENYRQRRIDKYGINPNFADNRDIF